MSRLFILSPELERLCAELARDVVRELMKRNADQPSWLVVAGVLVAAYANATNSPIEECWAFVFQRAHEVDDVVKAARAGKQQPS